MQDKLSIVAQRNGQKLLQQWPKGDYREVDETTGKNCWNGGVIMLKGIRRIAWSVKRLHDPIRDYNDEINGGDFEILSTM